MEGDKDIRDRIEKCLIGILKGDFILRNGERISSVYMKQYANQDFRGTKTQLIWLGERSYTLDGFYRFDRIPCDFDVIAFIPETEKDMKTKEAYVKISFETAREWYKKGGELREIALQAFTKCQLFDGLPRSWEEYLEAGNHPDKQYFIHPLNDSIRGTSDYGCQGNLVDQADRMKAYLPTKELAEKFLIYMQIMSLRQAWIKDWKPNWSGIDEQNWCIYCKEGKSLVVDRYGLTTKPLSFPSEEMAKEFLECFKDLLISTKGLY